MIVKSQSRDLLATSLQDKGWVVVRSPLKKLDGMETVDIMAMKNGQIRLFKIVVCQMAFKRLELHKETDVLNRAVNKAVGGMYDSESFSREHIEAHLAFGKKVDGRIRRWEFLKPTQNIVTQGDKMMELHEVLR